MEFVVNGKQLHVAADPDRPLLFVLRNQLGLTGAKYGCGEGQCGACTVLIDGVRQPSCITPARTVAGKHVTTIEGLADGDRLHPVQESFIECDAMQCGYCTAGMIMSSVALLHKNPAPSEPQIKEALEHNICRCGTYNRIVSAVQIASRRMMSGVKERRHA
ncbi:MAG: (2Fe-2S)-binding protein [Acidobacteriaceae bacterium]|nr:(2Fe-2S)-binding protein [Acidobacteriaceae bacterium]MBV9782167.1 (2Fe-2S)-binding protein [Acidobacteriaceae bacterium]